MAAREPTSDPSGWRLAHFTGTNYDKGRSWFVQAAWFAVSHLIFQKWWCSRRLRLTLLRSFGAVVGEGVLIRQRVRIHWPWKLEVGADTWIGEDVWILNLESVTIGRDVCLSQGAFLCTGSHDRRSASFEFDNAAISVEDQSWIATQALVLRGVTVGSRVVVGARSVITRDVPTGSVVPAAERW